MEGCWEYMNLGKIYIILKMLCDYFFHGTEKYDFNLYKLLVNILKLY